MYTGSNNMKNGRRLLIWILAIVVALLLLRLASSMTGTNYYFITQTNNYGSSAKQPINNFEDFPCLNGVVPSAKLKNNGKCVRSISRLNIDKPKSSMQGCTILKAGIDTPICTYDPKKDIISEFLHREGAWEKGFVDIMLSAMDKHPNMMLFDVGSNIGVYCISAAVYGKRVVCLDANYENIRKLMRSLNLGKLTNNATLIWNAVSNQYQTIRFHVVKGNVGSSRIADLDKWGFEAEANIAVNAITLNDVQDYEDFKGKPIFMKLDVEAHELQVLLGAEEFFKKVDVRIVQVELAEPETKFEVIELFEKFGYLPYLDPLGKNRLYKPDAFTIWPTDMYFVREGLPSN